MKARSKTIAAKSSAAKRRWNDLIYKAGRSWAGDIVAILARGLLYFGLTNLSMKLALKAHRLTYSAFAFRTITLLLAKPDLSLERLVSPCPGDEVPLKRSIIVRWPDLVDGQVATKGIVIITFTQSFPYFFHKIDIQALATYFHIVLEPSSAGYMDPDILFWSRLSPHKVFVQSSELRDRVTLSSLAGNLVPVSFGASDWVDYQSFYPTDEQKEYDACYVANINPVKRIHVFLRAIKELVEGGHNDFRAILVCASWGGHKEEIVALVEHYGVEKHCAVAFSLGKENLNRVLSKSKVNVLLSLKEGSNRSLFESMLADTPVIALQENIGVNKAYINEFTGQLIYEHSLASTLISMRESWKSFSPRRWAMLNIAPEVTSAKLTEVVRSHERNAPSRQPIYVKTNNPEVNYLGYPNVELKSFTRRAIHLFSRDSTIGCPHGLIAAELTELQRDFHATTEKHHSSITSAPRG